MLQLTPRDEQNNGMATGLPGTTRIPTEAHSGFEMHAKHAVRPLLEPKVRSREPVLLFQQAHDLRHLRRLGDDAGFAGKRLRADSNRDISVDLHVLGPL